MKYCCLIQNGYSKSFWEDAPENIFRLKLLSTNPFKGNESSPEWTWQCALCVGLERSRGDGWIHCGDVSFQVVTHFCRWVGAGTSSVHSLARDLNCMTPVHCLFFVFQQSTPSCVCFLKVNPPLIQIVSTCKIRVWLQRSCLTFWPLRLSNWHSINSNSEF